MIITDIKLSLANLRSSKIRSLLTMLGIVIGVASVLSIVALGNGIKQQVNSQISQLGNDLAIILPGHETERTFNGQITGFNLASGGTISTLSAKDLQTVESTSGVKAVSGSMSISGNISYRQKTLPSTSISGVSDSFLTTSGQKLARGQFFDTVGNSNAVVISSKVAQELFGSNDPIAQTLTIRGKSFIVIGVLDNPAKDSLLSSQIATSSIYIPLDEAKLFNHNLVQLQNIIFRTNDPSDINRVTNQVQSAILKNHHSQQDFSIVKQNEIIETSGNIIEILTGFIAVIASISLLVGGIGIMNVMIAGVTERTREIGIRKSIGATNAQIWLQFLIEAAVLSLVGGLIGIGVAVGATYGLQDKIHITPVFDWKIITLAAGISIVIGIIFGVAPAIQAARKDPIESLRYE